MDSWVKSGKNWMWATWVGDAQVIYLICRNDESWTLNKKVSGGSEAEWMGHARGDKGLASLKQRAEWDSEKPL